MYFRFVFALVLVLLTSLVGVALEKRNLELRGAISRQRYRLEVLLNQHATQRTAAQQLGAPLRLIDTLDQGTLPADAEPKPPPPARNNPKVRRKAPTAPNR